MQYEKNMGKRMIAYFTAEGEVLPSFVRFAHLIGADTETLALWRRRYPAFERAYRECREILCDRIVYGAMHKRFDPSFSKFLLTARFGWAEKEEDGEDREFALRIRVLEDGEEDKPTVCK